jgi:phosphoribosylformimino-5-aminoimidazole carboxamide ribonucleotide (ProFAR) isomerase
MENENETGESAYVDFGSYMTSDYTHIGTFLVFEAKRLLTALEKAGVRIQVSVDDAGLRNSDLTAWLGQSGHSVKMIVAVHREDFEKALGIMSDLGM